MISEILKIDFEKMRNAELCAARTSLDINIALTFLLIKLENKILFEVKNDPQRSILVLRAQRVKNDKS